MNTRQAKSKVSILQLHLHIIHLQLLGIQETRIQWILTYQCQERLEHWDMDRGTEVLHVKTLILRPESMSPSPCLSPATPSPSSSGD